MSTVNSSEQGKRYEIEPPKGKLGVLIPGMGGAVSTTFIAGVEAIRKGVGRPIGSLTQMGTIRLGKRTENNFPLIKDFIELAGLDDLVFGGWDIFPDNCYEAAIKAGVLSKDHLDKIKKSLEKKVPMKAVFSQDYIKNLSGPHVKKGKTKMHLADQLIEDIETFKKDNKLNRVVLLWCGSTRYI